MGNKNNEKQVKEVANKEEKVEDEVISNEGLLNSSVKAFKIFLQHRDHSYESSGHSKLPLDSIKEEHVEELDTIDHHEKMRLSLAISVENCEDAPVDEKNFVDENKELDLKGNHMSQLLQDSDHHKFRNSSFKLKKKIQD
jgi:hypothetical protein